MSNPFDYVNAINAGKDIIRNSPNSEIMEKEFNSFIILRAFSYYPDTVLIANELNINNNISNLFKNDFLLSMITPRKRFSKWAKRIASDDITLLMNHYKINYERAKEVLDLLSPSQLDEIKNKNNKGGLVES